MMTRKEELREILFRFMKFPNDYGLDEALDDIERLNKPKFSLHAGICGMRWSCNNLNTKCCHTIPKKGKDYVKCDYYLDK